MSTRQKRILKPLLIILIILAVIAVSMLGATLSAYVKELSLFNDGWVGPKYFAFEIDSNGETKGLAPGESVYYKFFVRNHNENGVAQVPLHVSIEIDYPPQLAGTGIIEAELYYGETLLVSNSGTGSIAITGETLPAGIETTDTYSLKLTWKDSDMTYLGEIQSTSFDNSTINISVSGYQ